MLCLRLLYFALPWAGCCRAFTVVPQFLTNFEPSTLHDPGRPKTWNRAVPLFVGGASPIETAQCLLALDDNSFPQAGPVVLVPLALFLGIAANGWIQKLLSGKQGLGGYLSDGSGFNKSSFQPLGADDRDRAVSSDPLPWLRLPKLDFVQVAGQTEQDHEDFETGRLFGGSNNDRNDGVIFRELETIRSQLQQKVQENDLESATILKGKLERIMSENGIEYKEEE